MPQKNSGGAHHFRFRFLDLCIRFGKIISKVCEGFNSGAEKLELLQSDFARKADVPYTTLTKIETGVIKKPSVFVVSKIAKALNVTIEELIK